jgi:hypothetical protein
MLPAWIVPFVAQVTREQFGRGFRGATSQLHWTDILPYAAAIALLILGTMAYSRYKRWSDLTERCDDPHKLFRELSMAHQLDRPSRRLLLHLAEAGHFAQPAQIFLSPAAFEPSRLPQALRTRAEDVRRLRERLFQG